MSDSSSPLPASGQAPHLLVGPGGVFVIDVKNWRSAPAEGSSAPAGSRDEQAAKLLAMTKAAESAVAS